MKRDLLRLVRRYGCEAVLTEDGVDTLGMVFLQTMQDRGEKWEPTPLGRQEKGRMLCLCEPGLAPEKAGEEARLTCCGTVWRIVTAQAVRMGSETLFSWAVLLPAEEEEESA